METHNGGQLLWKHIMGEGCYGNMTFKALEGEGRKGIVKETMVPGELWVMGSHAHKTVL